MTSDERNELLEDANQLAYTAIKFTGMYKELTSAEWDGLAERWGRIIAGDLERLVDMQFTAREAAKESVDVR